MGNNLNDKVRIPLGNVAGGLVGSNLLTQLKADMMLQSVFQAMFGSEGKQIFIGEAPSYNESIFPLIEFWFGREVYGNHDTYLTGTIRGHIILPSKIQPSADSNFQRQVANAFQRFLGSKRHNLFKEVKGLIEFGLGTEFLYDQMFVFSGGQAPAIDFSIPYKFDMHLLKRLNQGIDYDGDLDEQLVGLLETIKIKVTDDNTESPLTLIPEGVLFETGQENP